MMAEMANTTDWSDIAMKFGILTLIVLVTVLLHKYWTKTHSTQSTEKFLMGAPIESKDHQVKSNNDNQIAANEYMSDQHKRVDNMFSSPFPKDCFPRDKVHPQDLFPSGDAANSEFAQMTPLGQGDVHNKNFLDAGYHVGINTVGTSRRNPNLSLRAEPPNPKVIVSPWMNSTIDPDTMTHRPLEIGGCV